jgi:hypothetical protein
MLEVPGKPECVLNSAQSLIVSSTIPRSQAQNAEDCLKKESASFSPSPLWQVVVIYPQYSSMLIVSTISSPHTELTEQSAERLREDAPGC